MKKTLFATVLLAALLAGCAKEDDIRPLVGNTDTLQPDKCLIGHDTLSIGSAARFAYYDPYYYFYNPDGQLILQMLIPEDSASADLLTSIPCTAYLHGDTLAFRYTVSLLRHGNTYRIQAQGTNLQDTTLRMRLNYSNTLLDINQPTGQGFLARDFDTIPLDQLTLHQAHHNLQIFGAQNIDTYSLGRIRIQGDIHSGLFELGSTDAIQVFYEIGIPRTCPGVRSYPIVDGQLQYSANNGLYSITLHGATEHWKIAFQYNGHGLNAADLPLSWD